jgi:hypothetical protein
MPTTQAISARLLTLFSRSLDGDLNKERNVHIQRFINIAIGITYGIARAQSLHFDPRQYDARRTQLALALYKRSREQVLTGLIDGSLASDPHWAGGYYFNSSIYRIDTLAQILSKFIFADLEGPVRKGDRRSTTEKKLINANNILRLIANERNQLDHHKDGLIFRRKIFYEHLLEGLSLLVDILEQQVNSGNNKGHP